MICHIQIFQIPDSGSSRRGWGEGGGGYKRLDKRRDLQAGDMMDHFQPRVL